MLEEEMQELRTVAQALEGQIQAETKTVAPPRLVPRPLHFGEPFAGRPVRPFIGL